MLNIPHITISEATIADFCQRNHIRKLALFGSVLRDDFTPDSDIDVLVEFEPDHALGFECFAIQAELSGILGREVDLLTFNEIFSMENYIRRRHILNSLRTIYDVAG